MKLLFVFLFAVSISFGQKISGEVFDKNNEPIVGATVYLDGTSIGVSTDTNGKFELSPKSKYNTSLVIKFIGYENFIISNPYEKEFWKITLIEKKNEIETVVVKNDDPFTRKQKLKLFRHYFLGVTREGRNCTILNEDDLNFRYDTKKNVFTATSLEPIKVINSELQYELEFTLMEFKVDFSFTSILPENARQTFFLGTSVYKDLINEKNKENVTKKRDRVYFRSQTYLYKTIVENLWSKKGFRLFRNKFYLDNPSNYLNAEKENEYYKIKVVTVPLRMNNEIYYNERYSFLYDNKHQSDVIFKYNYFYVDQNYNLLNKDIVIFMGDIGNQKIGNLLPLDYLPTNKIDDL